MRWLVTSLIASMLLGGVGGAWRFMHVRHYS
jgi:hypothetical protein